MYVFIHIYLDIDIDTDIDTDISLYTHVVIYSYISADPCGVTAREEPCPWIGFFLIRKRLFCRCVRPIKKQC